MSDGSAADLDGAVNGQIETTWLVPGDAADTTLLLSAQGESSHLTAKHIFTDATNAADGAGSMARQPNQRPSRDQRATTSPSRLALGQRGQIQLRIAGDHCGPQWLDRALRRVSSLSAGFVSGASANGGTFGSLAVSGQTITINFTTSNNNQGFTVTFANATAPVTAGRIHLHHEDKAKWRNPHQHRCPTVGDHVANNAPVAVNDTASATEAGGVSNGTAGVDPTGNVLTNDTDPDSGDTKTVSAGSVGSFTGSFGTLNLAANGSYTYTVDNANTTVQALRLFTDTLTDGFAYTMHDAAGLTSSATLTVTIHGANDNPVAVDDSASATEAGGVSNGTAGVDPTGNVLTNDTDPDVGDTKTVSAGSVGTDGQLRHAGSRERLLYPHGEQRRHDGPGFASVHGHADGRHYLHHRGHRRRDFHGDADGDDSRGQ